MISYNKIFFIILTVLLSFFFVNASINSGEILSLNSEDIDEDIVEIDLAEVSKVILDLEEIKFEVNSENDLMVFVSNEDFFRVYKIPVVEKDVEIMYTYKDVSAKFVIKNIDVFVQNYKLKQSLESQEVVFDSLGRQNVIIEFSDEISDEALDSQVGLDLLEEQVVSTDSLSDKEKKFNFVKQKVIEVLEEEALKRRGISRLSGNVLSEQRVLDYVERQSNKYWVKREFRKFNGISAQLSENEILALEKLEYVKKIAVDEPVQILMDETSSYVNATEVWNMLDSSSNNLTGQGVIVAVIDTGVDYNHSDFGSCSEVNYLADNCARFVRGYDFYNNDDNPMDDQGHGTHVAGIVGANSDAIRGIAPDVTIMPIKVLSASGGGSMSDIIAGIEFAMDPNSDEDYSDKVDVISLSLGGSGHPDDDMSKVVDLASNIGIAVVVAAGNSGPDKSSIMSPGVAREAITVGASCRLEQIGVEGYCLGNIAEFSSRGPTVIGEVKPDIVAPGVSICSSKHSGSSSSETCIDSKHIANSGTSMATPVVSGVVALLKQSNSDLTSTQIKGILMLSANDLGEDLNDQGSGEVDALKAVNTKVVVDPVKVSFGNVNQDVYSANVTITNIDSSLINVSIFAANFSNEIGQESDLDILISNATILLNANESKQFNFSINASYLQGFVTGKIFFNVNNVTSSMSVSYDQYSNLEIKLVDDVSGNLMDPYYVLVSNGDYTIVASQISLDTFDARLTPSNFSVIVIGDDSDEEYTYILADDVELVLGNNSISINMSNSRDYTVSGQSFDGKNLTLYEYDYGFLLYENSSSSLSGVMVYGYGVGDQKLKISNKPEFVSNLDVIAKYEGVPRD